MDPLDLPVPAATKATLVPKVALVKMANAVPLDPRVRLVTQVHQAFPVSPCLSAAATKRECSMRKPKPRNTSETM